MGKESRQINMQYDRQLENQTAQNDWQSAENQIDAQRQQQMWMEQFAKQVQQQNEMFEKEGSRWQEQFDIQNQYNSPESQVSRLTAAGINPSALASTLSTGSSAVSVGGSTGVSSPSPLGVGSHSVTPGHLNSPVGLSSDAALFSSAAQLADSVGKLGKYGVESSSIMRKVGAEVENIVSDTELKRVQKISTDLNNSLTETFGKERIGAEIQEIYARSYQAYSQGNLNGALEDYNKALKALTDVDTKFKNDSYYIALANLKSYGNVLTTQAGLNKAKSSEAYASASYQTALANTADLLRSGQVKAQELSNELLSIQKSMQNRENIRDAATHQDKVNAIVAECERAQLINQQVGEQIKKAVTDNDWNTVEHFFGVLGSVTGSVGDVGNILVGHERNDVQREFNRVWENYLNDKNKPHQRVVGFFGQ